jgi:hypothetical protein
MRGRWPSGLEYIDKLEGTVESKDRLKAILETLHGQARLLEACAQLEIGETRFHQLRETALQAALTALESRPAGRPCRTSTSEAERIRSLEQRVKELEQALYEAQIREEIALVLPNLRRSAGDDERPTEVGKKMPRQGVKIRKSR